MTPKQHTQLRKLVAELATPESSGLAVSEGLFEERVSDLTQAFPELAPSFDALHYAMIVGNHGSARIKTFINDSILVCQWHTNYNPERGELPKRIEVCYLS